MMVLALIAVVLVPFAFFWWAGRDIQPDRNGAQENVIEAAAGRSTGWGNDLPPSGHDGIHH